MKYHRYGHCERIKFKVGDKVKKGQLIAENGTGNGQWYAHCHYDILTYKPALWTEFCVGKSKEWVKAHYADPRGNEKLVMPTFDHLGYGWLSDAQYAGGHAFHPGLDLNGKGSGNADLDDPLHSACDGVVVYVYSDTGKNSGWGDMIIIQEIIEVPKLDTEQTPKIEAVPIPVKVEAPTRSVEIPVADPIVILKAETQPLPEEIKSEVVPVDLKFIIGKIIEFLKVVFSKYL